MPTNAPKSPTRWLKKCMYEIKSGKKPSTSIQRGFNVQVGYGIHVWYGFGCY